MRAVDGDHSRGWSPRDASASGAARVNWSDMAVAEHTRARWMAALRR